MIIAGLCTIMSTFSTSHHSANNPTKCGAICRSYDSTITASAALTFYTTFKTTNSKANETTKYSAFKTTKYSTM